MDTESESGQLESLFFDDSKIVAMKRLFRKAHKCQVLCR